jgi:hypothetical protein
MGPPIPSGRFLAYPPPKLISMANQFRPIVHSVLSANGRVWPRQDGTINPINFDNGNPMG